MLSCKLSFSSDDISVSVDLNLGGFWLDAGWLRAIVRFLRFYSAIPNGCKGQCLERGREILI